MQKTEQQSVRKDRDINAYYSVDAGVQRRGSSESRNKSGKEKSLRHEHSAYMDSGTADDKENLFSLSSTYPDRTVKKLSPTKDTISAQNFDFNQVQTMTQQSHKHYLSMPPACHNLIQYQSQRNQYHTNLDIGAQLPTVKEIRAVQKKGPRDLSDILRTDTQESGIKP